MKLGLVKDCGYMNIEIAIYKPEFHEKVVELITTIQWQEFNIPITYEEQPDLGAIDDFYNKFLVALHENTPVGTIGYKAIDDYAIIRKMFVHKEFRGKLGVAQKLLETIESEISKNNINKIYLGTTEFFKSAHRFYEKNGYVDIPMASLPLSFPVIRVDTKFYYKPLNITI